MDPQRDLKPGRNTAQNSTTVGGPTGQTHASSFVLWAVDIYLILPTVINGAWLRWIPWSNSEQDSLDCTVHTTASHTGGKQCNVFRTLPTASPTSPKVSNNYSTMATNTTTTRTSSFRHGASFYYCPPPCSPCWYFVPRATITLLFWVCAGINPFTNLTLLPEPVGVGCPGRNKGKGLNCAHIRAGK